MNLLRSEVKKFSRYIVSDRRFWVSISLIWAEEKQTCVEVFQMLILWYPQEATKMNKNSKN